MGVDYGIYLYDRIEIHIEEGLELTEAFFIALRERGTAMIFTAITMTLGVGTWAMSALKFQADMGILLANRTGRPRHRSPRRSGSRLARSGARRRGRRC